MMYKQDRPFALQVELTEGCNLRCSFCGIHGIRSKNRQYRFMSVQTAERIVQLLKLDKWRPRIEFAMHGEPSLNPEMIGILSVFRRRLPRGIHLMMTSNGHGFVRNPELVDESLKYLNVLGIEDYEHSNLARRLKQTYNGVHPVILYPDDPTGNPHRRRKTNEHDLVFIQCITKATRGTHHVLNNHCGCGAPLSDAAVGKRCAKPFRELSIRWDGNVALCCNDWRGLFKVGNIRSQTLEELWQSPAMMAARCKLYLGQRTFPPCQGCNALSYRVGLLPDSQGKQVMPPPTPQDDQAIRRALAGAPYTPAVLRPWEGR